MNGNAIQGLLYSLCIYGEEKSKMSKMIVMFQAFVFGVQKGWNITYSTNG